MNGEHEIVVIKSQRCLMSGPKNEYKYDIGDGPQREKSKRSV